MEPIERRWRENGEGWRNMEMVVRNLCRIILYMPLRLVVELGLRQ
jgi:hypothetical protein